MKRLFGVSLCISLVCAAACGGRSSSSQGQAAPVPESQFTDSAANAFCAGVQACCSSKGFSANASVCNTNLRSTVLKDSCQAPFVYDAQAAGDCIAQVQNLLSTCSIVNDGNAAACRNVCVGSVALGSPCNNYPECANSSKGDVSCMPTSASGAASVCVATPHGKPGDPCQATCTAREGGYQWSCPLDTNAPGNTSNQGGLAKCYTNDGLYCSTLDGTCHPSVVVGGACTGSNDCGTAAYCDSASSTCIAKAVEGDACSAANACADGTYCPVASGCFGCYCTAALAAGQPCSADSVCNDGSCDTARGICVPNNSTVFVPTADSCANPTLD